MVIEQYLSPLNFFLVRSWSDIISVSSSNATWG